MSTIRDFFLQLETALTSGMPLIQALNNIGSDCSGLAMKRKILKIASNVESGMTFSEAVQRVGHPFSTMHVSFIRFGEETGTLDKVCETLAEYADRDVSFERNILLSLAYPMFLLLVISMGAPFLQVIIDGEPWHAAVWPSIQGLAFFVFFLFAIYSIYYLVSNVLGISFLIRFPFIGEIIKKMSLCRFTRTLGVGLGAGVPMNQALETAIKVTSNSFLESDLKALTEVVNSGRQLGEGMKTMRSIPSTMREIIATGESSGKLPEVLKKVSDNFQEEALNKVAILTKILPVLFYLPVAIYMAKSIIGFASKIFSYADFSD